MRRPRGNVGAAIAGKLVPTARPICPGCAVKHGQDALNLHGFEQPCSVCREPTTWRAAVSR